MKLLERARPEILGLQAYSSARGEADAAAIMLNANESPWAMAGDASALNRYPDPQPAALRTALAQLYAVSAEQVLIGRGSDEAIDLLVRAFCSAGRDAVMIAPPTFGMYAVAARIQGAAVIEVPLDADFGLDAAALMHALTDATKLVFVCTPNNPTGQVVGLSTLRRIAEGLRDRALLVIDEAYVEFAADAPSATSLLRRHENIAVLRTLSKAHALAGARIGVLIAAAPIIEVVRKIQPPYPLPRPALNAALAALAAPALAQTTSRIRTVREQRECLARALTGAPEVCEVFDSAANFLCVRFRDAAQVYRQLLARGIVVRDVSRYRLLQNCLRISIGTADENDALLAALGVTQVRA
jgi:histidinol-phosphate aminotransferase